ncbi:accessory Sec system protein Asp2 [Lactobacillus sp. 0.1XD8-4]|uniref:accessory Sec system protein Asp2 n=1 Tax=uncultured Limosilactobacillus sp. TaxID=2837629 RepID=UPI00272BF103|nr:accessory Sec system protein Asp2 [uncultured Limosilactobacillus sp.]MRN07387.1 accessory Sec system protein Asp2 [Lactobacillus sp. 0.1XD8-4]
MQVLQLGAENWADKYQLPSEITWTYNQYPLEKVKQFDLVIITLGAQLTDDLWEKLQWQVDPYRVLYEPLVEKNLSSAGQHFLICQEARQIVEEPQELIDNLNIRYFPGQSGMRIPPTNLLLNSLASNLLDGGHLQVTVNTDHWKKIGNYRQQIYIDPNRLLKFNLEYNRDTSVKVRLRFFVQEGGGDGNLANNYVLDFSMGNEEQILPLKPADIRRFVSVGVEVIGKGKLTIGMLHSRWSRDGKGEFLPGGKRLVDPDTGADIAYYFNPGDLQPPLHVYFSGARELEGFEAYPLFRRNHTPALLFTDPRLAVGQFYTGETIENQIKSTIIKTLKKLGFNRQQLVMNGISMGTYPAIKLGAQLSAYAINVAKPTVNLGRVAIRARLQRPDEFDTIFDIDRQLVSELTTAQLTQLDTDFWKLMDKNDLTQTRFYVGYMTNDDYDDLAVPRMRANRAIEQVPLFVSKGFQGRHNDDPSVVYWFVSRLAEINQTFGRGD